MGGQRRWPGRHGWRCRGSACGRALDYSYQRQLETLTRIRRAAARRATSRKRLELQLDALEQQAARLAARNRAHTLAEARQRMRLTQAQGARRMDVRQERGSAIERAEPGATEVRTLAAYVRALGGRLEIVAHIGSERIVLT